MKQLFFGFFLFVSLYVYPQKIINNYIDDQNCREGESVEYCKTHKVMHTLKANSEFLTSFINDQRLLKEIEDSISNFERSNTVYKIPLVFHVLHNNGNENISDDQIHDAVDILTSEKTSRLLDELIQQRVSEKEELIKELGTIQKEHSSAKKWRKKVVTASVQGSLTIKKLKNYALELERVEN